MGLWLVLIEKSWKNIPSGKLRATFGQSQFNGKRSTISVAIFNSKLSVLNYQRVEGPDLTKKLMAEFTVMTSHATVHWDMTCKSCKACCHSPAFSQQDMTVLKVMQLG